MLRPIMLIGRLDTRIRRQISSLCICLLFILPAISFATRPPTESRPQVWYRSAELDELLNHGRIEFRHMEHTCQQNETGLACQTAQWRVHLAEHAVTNHPAFPPDYRPSILRQCLYASVVACSLLGGPDPSEQGLTPWSVLTGQELTHPLEHFRKWASESGSKK